MGMCREQCLVRVLVQRWARSFKLYFTISLKKYLYELKIMYLKLRLILLH